MSCTSKAMSWAATCYTRGSTSAAEFVPLSGPLEVSNLDLIAATMEIVSLTTNFTVQPAYRFSDNGVNWESPQTDAVSYASSTGFVYDKFYAVDTAAKRYVQWGLRSKNGTGTDIEKGFVILTLNVRS